MEEIFLSLRVLPAFCGANRTRQGIKSALRGNTTDEREVGSMQGKVEISCVNTAKLLLLSSKETETLLRQARDGDHAARERLIHGNLHLVLSVIQRFLGRGENADDLFQVGCIGLMKAIDNFDPAHAVKFSTYGVPMIAGEIRRYLRDNSAMRVSRGMRDVAYRALQTREKLTVERGREPDVDEIAAALGVPRSEVVFAMDAICEPVSLYEPVYTESGENVTMMDQVGDTKKYGRALADPSGALRSAGRALRTRKAHPFPALSGRPDANGGRRGNRHLAGAGLPSGKRRGGTHQKKQITS